MIRQGKPQGKPRGNSDCYCNYYLREARVNAGYTLKELAEKIGISSHTMWAYEQLRCMPNDMTAGKIGRSLKKFPYELFPKELAEIAREVNRERRGNENQRYFEKLKEKVESGKASISEIRKYRQLERLVTPVSIEDVQEKELVSEDDSMRIVSAIELADKLKQIFNTLTCRERVIVNKIYGLGDGYTYTLEEVAKEFKVSRERIRQIEAKAVRKLQHPVRANLFREYLGKQEEEST